MTRTQWTVTYLFRVSAGEMDSEKNQRSRAISAHSNRKLSERSDVLSKRLRISAAKNQNCMDLCNAFILHGLEQKIDVSSWWK